MSPFSFPVLAGTAVIASPALYAAVGTGSLSPDVALVRVMLCAIGVWMVCSVVAWLASRAVATNDAAAPGSLAESAAAPVPGAQPDAA